MNNKSHVIPRIAIQSVATGLFMMAFFTIFWTGIGHTGLAGRDNNLQLIPFGLLVGAFIYNGIYFFSAAKSFQKHTSDADKEEGKKSGKWFGIIFGAEGLLIFIGINLVNNLGHPELDIPVIALIVGLHFYPLGKVFKRSLDYYLATWSTLVAVLSIVFSLNKTLSPNDVFAFLGIGLAIATSGYGIYMIINGRGMIKKMRGNAVDSPAS